MTERENGAVEPQTRYARSGDVNIAYQVLGEGPFDLVFVPGYVTHWSWPGSSRGSAVLSESWRRSRG